jgi:hypothetical protein
MLKYLMCLGIYCFIFKNQPHMVNKKIIVKIKNFKVGISRAR